MILPKRRRCSLLVTALVWPAITVLAGCPSQVAKSDSEETNATDSQPLSEGPLTEGDATSPEIEQPVAHASDREQHAKHANRLANETSPYLLLHAHNPVDWHPWGEEAFAQAKKENKPIFLSIGYSSCYWCHVMERESFMDEEIAKFLNDHFVCVKVDREERPDVDDIYMAAIHLLRQRGGWPLSAFLTSDGRPFFGGTYWPARDGDRRGQPGFLTIATMVQEAWKDKQELIEKDADTLSEAVRQRLRGQQSAEEIELDHAMIEGVWADLRDEFDPKWGGFGYSAANPQMPKFPEPSNLMFLIDRIQRKDVEDWEEAREMLTATLDKMAQGGIYDHLGGGFHRYSVDRFWHIPHFEKMLYDNGQLASVYAEAYELTENEEYRLVVEGILKFVQREMTDSGGAFYAALDAETDAEEGKFYRWEKHELDELLSESERELFGEIYSLNGEPNFEEEYYVPMLSRPLSAHAEERGLTLRELVAKLQPTRQKLFDARSQRERPLTDTKILTSWNGLMIRGFADAGRLLENARYVGQAEQAATFVLNELRNADGRLLRTHTAGEAKLNAYLDDYAFLVDALIALDRASGNDLPESAIDLAQRLTEKQIELFWDDDGGGYFFTSNDHEALIARAKDPVDTVIPSGNSVAAGNLLYLIQKTDGEEATAYQGKARQTMLASGLYLRASPGAVPRMAIHLAEYLDLAKDLPKVKEGTEEQESPAEVRPEGD